MSYEIFGHFERERERERVDMLANKYGSIFMDPLVLVEQRTDNGNGSQTKGQLISKTKVYALRRAKR